MRQRRTSSPRDSAATLGPGRLRARRSGLRQGTVGQFLSTRVAATRGPNLGRRDRAEPLANPTRARGGLHDGEPAKRGDPSPGVPRPLAAGGDRSVERRATEPQDHPPWCLPERRGRSRSVPRRPALTWMRRSPVRGTAMSARGRCAISGPGLLRRDRRACAPRRPCSRGSAARRRSVPPRSR